MENKISRWQENKITGKCYSCKKNAVKGTGYCDFHLEKRRKYEAKRRKKPLCIRCGGPKEVSGFCKKCWSIVRERTKELKSQKRQRGECLTCANQVEELGKSYCNSCRSKATKYGIKRKKTRRRKGLCEDCGSDKAYKKSGCCSVCYCKRVSVRHFNTVKKVEKLWELLNSQNGCCPYTGKKLILGENASLDHKMPKSRGGSNNFSNLQWVYMGNDFDVNTMKQDLTDEEFRQATYIIGGYVKGIINELPKNK